MKKIACLFLFILFFAGSVQAEEGGSENVGLKLYNAELEKYIDAPGIATEMSIDVNGTIARTKVIQYFANNTESWQEGIYTWPLPDDAAVDHLVMVVGDRRILGFVAQKEKARQIYEQAKAEGKATSIVEQHRPNIFRTSVANIPPNSVIAIETAYQSDVRIDVQDFSFRMPMAITPRYDEFSPEDFVTFVSSKSSGAAHDVAERLALFDFSDGNNPVSLRITLSPEFDLGLLKSASHKIASRTQDNGTVNIVPEKEILPGEQDFVLNWSAKDTKAPLSFIHGEKVGEEYFSHLVLIPPEKIIKQAERPRQVTLIIDVSGSMSGPSIIQAKAALTKAVKDLSAKDMFNVIAFQSFTDRLFSVSKPASDENIKKALRWIDGLEAGGGTVMRPSVEMALKEDVKEGYLRQIVFMTDGAVGYEGAFGHYIRENVGDARFFVVGIGSAPNAHLMKMVAKAGRGTFTFIGNVKETEEKMTALFGKMKTPVLTNLQVHLPDGFQAEILPAKIPDLMLGEPVMLAVKSARPLEDFTVTGLQGSDSWVQQITTGKAVDADGISKIWARRKIQELKFSDPANKNPDTEMQITTLGIDHQIMSDYTSLVAVDEKILRPAGVALASHRYNPNQPKGWQLAGFDPREVARSYDKILQEQQENAKAQDELNQDINLPQTATGWQFMLIFGLMLMISGWMLLIRMENDHETI